MGIFYAEEHLSCINYQKCAGSAIDLVDIEAGDVWQNTSKFNQIIFILEGAVNYTTNTHSNVKNVSNKALLFLANSQVDIRSEKGAKMIVVRIAGITKLCDAYALNKLLHTEKYDPKKKTSSLEINNVLENFLTTLHRFISDGIRCVSYYEIKIKEMFLIFRTYYPKPDMLHFLYPLLTNDMSFSEYIMSNYTRVRTVGELAELTNYSLSGFQKKFKKVFNMPAHQWLTEQRTKAIFQDINNPEIPLKEICSKYQFSSISYFNDYCKLQFGKTPGQLRKGTKK